MAAIRALEQWCKTQCDGYSDVAITNMTTSFKNGLAFCALIHKYRPDLIDYDSLKEEDVFENNRLAFQVAEEKLGIPALLDAEDMVALRIPDRLSILTYVSQYYNYFKGRPPMGGVKRPAEGSKEEPSEKKNLPVVAKSFASKNGTSLPSTLTENANKHGTLHSKCVACRSHVHLVQRHLVDGKLYHRSCFKCSECSSVLHAGGFKPGKKPDTYICSAHQNGCKPSSSAAGIKNGPASSAARLNGAVGARPASRPPSVLSAPPDVVLKPAGPAPPSRAWTASAHRTQAARQRFFQAAAPATAASAGHGKSTEPSGAFGKVAQIPSIKSLKRLINSSTNMHIIFPVKNLVPPSRLSEVTFTYSVTLESLLSHVFYQVKSHHIPAEQIERDLADIETNMAHLEQEGVGLEKQLRRCEEEGEGDLLMDPLMVDWFNLIRKKQLYIRKESELVYTARTQELEQQQSAVEAELRGLLEEPDYLKSRDEQQREKKLMRRLMEIVDGRNAIVEGLDEDRLREVEEDQRLNEMMQNLGKYCTKGLFSLRFSKLKCISLILTNFWVIGVKKAKHKRKSSISKLFRRRSKRRVE
uniref:Mical-like 2a n=1 Tax=Gasterosteus aculeatus aculeatus TaxID=481459 RepID=A0AAQ4PZG7_GASAC